MNGKSINFPDWYKLNNELEKLKEERRRIIDRMIHTLEITGDFENTEALKDVNQRIQDSFFARKTLEFYDDLENVISQVQNIHFDAVTEYEGDVAQPFRDPELKQNVGSAAKLLLHALEKEKKDIEVKLNEHA